MIFRRLPFLSVTLLTHCVVKVFGETNCGGKGCSEVGIAGNSSCNWPIKSVKKPEISLKDFSEPRGRVEYSETFSKRNSFAIRIICRADYSVNISICPVEVSSIGKTHQCVDKGEKLKIRRLIRKNVFIKKQFISAHSETVDLLLPLKSSTYLITCAPTNCIKPSFNTELIVNTTKTTLRVAPIPRTDHHGTDPSYTEFLCFVYGTPVVVILVCLMAVCAVHYIQERRNSANAPEQSNLSRFTLRECSKQVKS